MKFENYRTKVFRNIVSSIKQSRNHINFKKIYYNFNNKSEVKKIRLPDNKIYNDIVAYYYYNSELYTITINDVLKQTRKVKLDAISGNKIEANLSKIPRFELNIGDKVEVYRRFYPSIVEYYVCKKTATTVHLKDYQEEYHKKSNTKTQIFRLSSDGYYHNIFNAIIVKFKQ